MGEFLDTLMSFGFGHEHPLIRTGTEFLLSVQNPDGSWGDANETDIYKRYHPTWTSVNGLMDYAFPKGEGPSFPAALRAVQGKAGEARAAEKATSRSDLTGTGASRMNLWTDGATNPVSFAAPGSPCRSSSPLVVGSCWPRRGRVGGSPRGSISTRRSFRPSRSCSDGPTSRTARPPSEPRAALPSGRYRITEHVCAPDGRTMYVVFLLKTDEFMAVPLLHSVDLSRSARGARARLQSLRNHAGCGAARRHRPAAGDARRRRVSGALLRLSPRRAGRLTGRIAPLRPCRRSVSKGRARFEPVPETSWSSSSTPSRPRHPEKANRPDSPMLRKPDWIRVKAPTSAGYAETTRIVREHGLQHRVRRSELPEHRRVLGAEARDLHDHGRHLHARLRVLQRQDRPAGAARRAGAGARSPTRSRGSASTTWSSPRSTATISPTAAPAISPTSSGDPRAHAGHHDRGADARLPAQGRRGRDRRGGAAGRVQPQSGDRAVALSHGPPGRALLRVAAPAAAGEGARRQPCSPSRA